MQAGSLCANLLGCVRKKESADRETQERQGRQQGRAGCVLASGPWDTRGAHNFGEELAYWPRPEEVGYPFFPNARTCVWRLGHTMQRPQGSATQGREVQGHAGWSVSPEFCWGAHR